MTRFVKPAVASVLIAAGLVLVDTAALGLRAMVVGAAVAALGVEHRWAHQRPRS